MMHKKTFWEQYPDVYANLSIFLVVFLFILSGVTGLSGLIHPWVLVISEALKAVNLPWFLTSDKLLNWEFNGINQFFQHKIIYSQGKDNYDFKKKQYIKCLMPHGIMPYTILCLWGDKDGETFHWKNNTFITTHQLYQFPFISHYAKTCQGIPSSYGEMENILENKKSLVVYPGGLREMFACSHKKEIVVIKKRKGIFYMALKKGVSLLPVYTFGITSLYERSGVTVTLPFLFKNDKDSLAWYFGQYYTPFPRREKLLTVVGSPIPVEKKEKITLVDIELLRNRYITEVKRLYKKWAPYYDVLWRNRRLIIK
jgi:2-acylglycerol O-acyltransferase 2